MPQEPKYTNDPNLKDAWIHGMVESVFTLNTRLNLFDINIEVERQVVTIQGQVNNEIDQWLCGVLLQGLDHIKEVINLVEVVDLELLPDSVQGSKKTYFQWFSDLSTTALIKSKLSWNKTLSGSEIGVETNTGVVTLSGVVDYAANRALAELIVKNVDQVKDVDNQIKVA